VGNHRLPASVRAFLFVCRRFVAPRPLRSIPYSSSRNLRRHSRYPHPDSRCLYLIHDRSYPYSHHVYRYSHYSYSYSHNCTVLGIICTASRFCATKWSLPVGPSRASDNLQRWLQPRVLVIKAAWVGGAFSARLCTTSTPRPGSPLSQLHQDRASPCHIGTGTGLISLTSAPGPGTGTSSCAGVQHGVLCCNVMCCVAT
jgi:hypothetical protein